MGETDLKARQEAGQRVEKKMMEYLLQFSSADDLTVSTIKHISFLARQAAFEEFSKIGEPS